MTAHELKAAQNKLGYTDQEMAEQLNTPLPTYRKWKQGQRRVPGIVKVVLLSMFRELPIKESNIRGDKNVNNMHKM